MKFFIDIFWAWGCIGAKCNRPTTSRLFQCPSCHCVLLSPPASCTFFIVLGSCIVVLFSIYVALVYGFVPFIAFPIIFEGANKFPCALILYDRGRGRRLLRACLYWPRCWDCNWSRFDTRDEPQLSQPDEETCTRHT